MLVTFHKSLFRLVNDKLMAEASDLELSPGEWPDFIAVVDDHDEGLLFRKSYADGNNGEISSYHYSTKQNFELVILND